MGRAPCCEKANVKKGPWSPEEDAKLKDYIQQHGTGGNWIALPQKIGLRRCGKSCRLRWLNYLRPNIKHGGFSEEEESMICSLYISIGSRWSIIAAQLPGRTDNDIKNYWNTRLKKKLLGKQRKEHIRRAKNPKQEVMMKTESENFVVPTVINYAPYWPEMQFALPGVDRLKNCHNSDPTQDQHLKDQESIRNLLIKLGGRFSDTTTNFPNSLDMISSTQDQLYENSINMISSSTSMNSINSSCSQLMQSPNMYQGLENFPVELNAMIFSNPELQVDELENFYGGDMVNGSTAGTSSSESTGWGDMSSLVYPPMVSSYEACSQDHIFEEMRYLDSQY